MRHLSVAEPVAPGTRLLHIGLPKTGSSALQASAHASRKALREHGAVYAARGRHDRGASFAVVFDKTPAGFDDTIHQAYRTLVQRTRKAQGQRVLLSSETLSIARPHQVERLVRELGEPVNVVVTLRPIGAVLASRWQQQVQNHLTLSFEDFLRETFTPDADGVLRSRSFWGRYDLSRLVPRWASVVGEENITLVVLDPTDRSMLLDTFDRLLGVPMGTLERNPRVSNASLPYPAVEMLRRFGTDFAEAGRTREEWVKVVRQRARATWSLRRDLGFTAAPVRTPRWAAERANEVTLPMLDFVRSSGVTVVGDLDHLLVDPAQHPEEQAAPTEISTEVAGALAAVLVSAAARRRPARSQVDAVRGRAARAAVPALDEVPTADVVAELKRRAARRLGRG